VSVYVVVVAGETVCEPSAFTEAPSSVTDVAFVVAQLSVLESPSAIVDGFAVNESIRTSPGGGAEPPIQTSLVPSK
jgi:hypothetical protein